MLKRSYTDAELIAASNLVLAVSPPVSAYEVETEDEEQVALTVVRRRFRRCLALVQGVVDDREQEALRRPMATLARPHHTPS